MAVVSMKQLLEAGVHFGHQTRRWNPKMKRYIFTQRNGIHIIDLQKTVTGIEQAFEYVRDLSATGEKMLFVGTKKQAQEAVRDEAIRANQFYVNQRWLGGLLTNFKTIQERLRRLDELERMKSSGEMDLRPKKEQLRLGDEMTKLNRLLGGIRTMRRLPAALFIVDCQKEHLAVHEASRLGIPIVALVDTNADPDPVAYPIPANDDAIRAVRLLAGRMADAAIEGQQMRESMDAERDMDREQEYGAAATEEEAHAAGPPADIVEGDIALAFDEVDISPESENLESTTGLEAPLSGAGLADKEEMIEAVDKPVMDDTDVVPAPVEETDLVEETEPVVPMRATDELEPLPDAESETSIMAGEASLSADVESEAGQ